MNQPTTPNTVEDFLPLPDNGPCSDVQHGMLYTGRQMRAYVLADRAQRPTVAGSVDTPEFQQFIARLVNSEYENYMEFMAEFIAYINARLAPAAPSSTPEVDKLDRISERRAEKLAAPSEIEAAVELPPKPEMDSLADIAHAQVTPDDWDEDYRSTWQKLQVESRNKMQWRTYALQLRASMKGNK